MFGIFKKKTPVEKLQEKYSKLLEESHKLSHTDRRSSDLKAAEADQLLNQITLLLQEKE